MHHGDASIMEGFERSSTAGHGSNTNCTAQCAFPKMNEQHGGAHILGFDGSHLDFQGKLNISFSQWA